MTRLLLLLLFVLFNVQALFAQNYYRPRVALAPDGSYAIAWEEFRQLEFIEEWQIGVQRFSPAGVPLGQTIYFDPASCTTTDVWLSDGMEHVELAYTPTGDLLVIMEHFGEFSFVVSSRFTTEITMGIIDANGNVLDLNNTQACLQYKFIYPGDSDLSRPRFSFLPNLGALLLVTDGFFQGTSFRNSALAILDTNLNDVFERPEILHNDPSSSTAFHMWPDVASNGDIIATTWHRCPFIDNQGNAAECDIDVQFLDIQDNGTISLLSSSMTANAGDPVGTINIRPSVSMNASGESVIVWIDSRTGPQGDIFGQRYNASGQAVGANFQVSAGNGNIDVSAKLRPEVEILDDGQFMVVWSDSSSLGYQAWKRPYASDGTPLSQPQRMASDPMLATGQPDIASNGAEFITLYGADDNGSIGFFVDNQPVSAVSIETTDAEMPESMDVSVFPNPFHSNASIRFTKEEPGPVRIDVYNLIGQRIATPLNAHVSAGTHQANLDGWQLPAGIYGIRISASDRVIATTMVVKE